MSSIMVRILAMFSGPAVTTTVLVARSAAALTRSASATCPRTWKLWLIT